MKKLLLSLFLIVGLSVSSFAQYSQVESYIGEIRIFAGNYAPSGWAFCDGQTLPIAQNQALFAILGTTYGGDGVTNFKLPDLRSRTPIHSGGYQPSAGLRKIEIGEIGGNELTTILPNVVTLKTTSVKFDAQTTGRDGAPSAVQSVSVNPSGLPQQIDNRSPYLGINYIICLYGIFPSRN